ncbi:phosphoribosyltransferase-like protein [Glutamicibacter ardleyensis]|uniref:phosphoribosyltransferase-like protein n=1 Tax=Glutamicibacter ardleyensis TaxID=225894 RepID=UPI003F954B9E
MQIIFDQWLKQFSDTDRPLIRDLLVSFNGVSVGEMIDDFVEYLKDHFSSNTLRSCQVLIESVISEEDIKIKTSRSRYPLATSDGYYKYRAYVDYLPEEQRGKKSGSELYMDLAQRTVSTLLKYGTGKNNKVIRPTYKELSKKTELDVFLLVDNIGSGRQAITFLHSILHGLRFYVGPKKKIRIHLVTWCATIKGISKVRYTISEILASARYIDYDLNIELVFFNYSRTLEDIDDAEKRENIREVLLRSSFSTSRSGTTSYEDMNTLTIIEGHQCPNTTPYLFHELNNIGKPLFEARYVREGTLSSLNKFDNRIEDQPSIRNPLDSIANNRGYRLAWQSANFFKEMFWIRLAYATFNYSADEAFASISSTYRVLRDADKELVAKGYMSQDGKATERGRDALRSYGARNRFRLMKLSAQKSKKIFDGKPLIYYPRSIDGVS